MDPWFIRTELAALRDQTQDPSVQRSGPEHKAWELKVDALMLAGLGEGSRTLAEFRDLPYYVGVPSGAPDEAARDARFFAASVTHASGLIEAAIYELDTKLVSAGKEASSTAASAIGDDIFVVHGRDDARKYQLVRLLDRATDRDAVILHEQPNRGSTVLEKLERHAASACCAVILLTADDRGGLQGAEQQPRGRQNVIFEAGIFVGLLGRQRVVVLMDPDIEIPSDLSGLVYVPLDGAGAWQHGLLKELRAMGLSVDFARVP